MAATSHLQGGHDDNGNMPADQIHCQRWQAVILAVREAIFDRYVPAFGVVDFGEAAAERGQHRHIGFH